MAWHTGIAYGTGSPIDAALLNGIGNDLRAWGANVDAGAYGLSNAAFLVLNPGTLPASPTVGMIAVNSSYQVQIWTGSTWAAATTAVAAGIWWQAAGAPSSGTGSNGDMYLNSTTGDVYGPKSGGAWGSIVINIKGPTGSAGATGSTGSTGATGYSPVYIVAAGAPSGGTGNNGDMYINSTTSDLYGPKSGGVWGSVVANLKGSTGTNASAANWRGAYAGGTAYAQGDGVTYSGSAYVALQATTGNLPTNTTYWQNVSAGSVAWGSITGTLSSQSDLNSALGGKMASVSGSGLVKVASGTPGLASAGTDYYAPGGAVAIADLSAVATADVIFVIDGGGSALSTGVKGDLRIDFNCTITAWSLLADQSGSIGLSIWKGTLANYPPTVANLMSGNSGQTPHITTATNANSSTLTGWTTTISAGDCLRFNVDSATTITRVTLALKVTKT